MKNEITSPARVAALLVLAACLAAAAPQPVQAEQGHPLLAIMESELELSMNKLLGPDGIKPYFIQYSVTDTETVSISATLGAITGDDTDHSRVLDVSVRCGDYSLDSTHQIRGGGYVGGYDRWGSATALPLNDDPVATRHAIWLETDEQFKAAVKRLAQVKANVKVKVEEEDLSDDFSREQPSVQIDPWLEQSHDHQTLVDRIRRYSRRFREHPLIYNSRVSLSGQVTNRLAVNSEDSKLQFGSGWWRISVRASTIAEDGMELQQQTAFDAHSPDGLPDDADVIKAIDQVIAEILALRAAPVVEPYTGPAILVNRASGVFFHEIFGHRIEGHRQKDVEEGQTFAKKIGKQVLPTFLTVVDDASLRVYDGVELNGYYPFDDECVPSQPVRLVEDGVLETFLLSRSPTRGFTKSNGHGRCQPGLAPVARQGNLIVESKRQVSPEKLRAMLIEECRKQGKEYGLLFKDISGGFTMTQRFMPQAFKVIPILVYRVFPDGHEELVRGADIVGTPLTCFSKILCTGDDAVPFNGMCGAESGMVPVSAVSPSILIEQIEIEKKQKAQDRPPILAAPIAAAKAAQ